MCAGRLFIWNPEVSNSHRVKDGSYLYRIFLCSDILALAVFIFPALFA